METSDIYQKYLIDDFLRQVMSYRDEWRSGMWIQRKDCPDVISILKIILMGCVNLACIGLQFTLIICLSVSASVKSPQKRCS